MDIEFYGRRLIHDDDQFRLRLNTVGVKAARIEQAVSTMRGTRDGPAMSLTSKIAMVIVTSIGWTSAAAAERMTTTSQEAFACVSWAAWHEYVLESLRPQGARASKACPLRIASKAKVIVVEDDAGAGASEIRYRGRNWFVDNQRLNE